MQITRKRKNETEASYTLEGTTLENVDSIKYLGVTIIHNLRWSIFVCVEVLRPSQPNGVMSSAVSLPSHTFTGQA